MCVAKHIENSIPDKSDAIYITYLNSRSLKKNFNKNMILLTFLGKPMLLLRDK